MEVAAPEGVHIKDDLDPVGWAIPEAIIGNVVSCLNGMFCAEDHKPEVLRQEGSGQEVRKNVVGSAGVNNIVIVI